MSIFFNLWSIKLQTNDYGFYFEKFNNLVDSYLKDDISKYVESYFYSFEEPTKTEKINFQNIPIIVGVLRVPGYTVGIVVLNEKTHEILDIKIYHNSINYFKVSEFDLETILKNNFLNKQLN